MTAFIQLERYNAIKLVHSVHATLAALSKVIRGTQLLTTEVQELASALMNQEVILDPCLVVSHSLSLLKLTKC